jgi:hypothetical protein
LITQTARLVSLVQPRHFHFFLQEKPQTVAVEEQPRVLAVAVHLVEQIRQLLRLRQIFTQQTEEQGPAEQLMPLQGKGVVCKAAAAVVVAELQQTELQLIRLLLVGLGVLYLQHLKPQMAAAAHRGHLG